MMGDKVVVYKKSNSIKNKEISQKFDISIIIRFHDYSKLGILTEAILSICGQEGVNANPIIVCQNLDPMEFENLKIVISVYNQLLSGEISFINIISEYKDIRSKLLNVGIKMSNSQFISILDFDDVIYKGAYLSMIKNLINNEYTAIVFGGIVWAECEDIGGSVYISKKNLSVRGGSVYDLFYDNFCPIHSFVIDKSKIKKEDLVFMENMTMLEDYYFLLTICSNYKSDFSMTNIPIGEYRRRLNDTIRSKGSDIIIPEKENELEAAREKINQLKKNIKITLNVNDLINIRKYWSGHPVNISTRSMENEKYIKYFESINKERNSINEILFKLNIKNSAKWSSALVERVERENGWMRISGWITDGYSNEYKGSVFALTGDGVVGSANFFKFRSDIKKEYGVENAQFDIELFSVNGDRPLCFVVNNNMIYVIEDLY